MEVMTHMGATLCASRCVFWTCHSSPSRCSCSGPQRGQAIGIRRTSSSAGSTNMGRSRTRRSAWSSIGITPLPYPLPRLRRIRQQLKHRSSGSATRLPALPIQATPRRASWQRDAIQSGHGRSRFVVPATAIQRVGSEPPVRWRRILLGDSI